MNCKPDQLAWIVVPRSYYGSGIEQLNNHVVKTIALLPGRPESTWRVTPRQEVTFTTDAVGYDGRRIKTGSSMWTEDLPDSFLRPFDPDSAPKASLDVLDLEGAV